jgi:protein-disulfide isomerase
MPPAPRPPSPRPQPWRNRRLLLALGAALAVAAALIAGSLVLAGGGGEEAAPPATVTAPVQEDALAGIPQEGTVLGHPLAKVTILEYADLSCPVCRQYTAQILPALIDEYVRPGKVKLDFRGIAFISPVENSERALRYVLAAGRQDKLWQLAELVYANQGKEGTNWATDELLQRLAERVPGLDVERLAADAAGTIVRQQVEEIAGEAEARSVPGTPYLWIQVAGGPPQDLSSRLPGLSVEILRGVLEQALAS